MKIIILLSMIFLHIADDYYLQGILAQMKQKSWWESKTTNKLYKNDYIVALIEHGFSWTFVMMCPILVFMLLSNNIQEVPFLVMFVINWILHSVIDHCKANLLIINLVTDQLLHIIQVFITWAIFFGVLFT